MDNIVNDELPSEPTTEPTTYETETTETTSSETLPSESTYESERLEKLLYERALEKLLLNTPPSEVEFVKAQFLNSILLHKSNPDTKCTDPRCLDTTCSDTTCSDTTCSETQCSETQIEAVEKPILSDEDQQILNFYKEIEKNLSNLLIDEEKIIELSQPEIEELINFSNEKVSFFYNTFVKPNELYETYYNNSINVLRGIYRNCNNIDIQNLLLNNKILIIVLIHSNKQRGSSSYREHEDNGTIDYVISTTIAKKIYELYFTPFLI